jgi:hypothetical protein
MQSGADFAHLRAGGGEADTPECSLVQSGCHTVTQPPEAPPPDWVADALEGALERWRQNRNEHELRRALGQLLALL